MKSFQDVQFKGKGCEVRYFPFVFLFSFSGCNFDMLLYWFQADDLDMMMAIIELWGHRMFPQFTFTDLVEKIEKLGSKRAVHVSFIYLPFVHVPAESPG